VKKIFFIFMAITLLFSILEAKEVGGVDLKESITIENQKLILNGAGIRSIFLFDVYVGALYLTKREKDPTLIIESKKPMDIKMIITSSLVTSKRMIDGLIDAFKKAKEAGYDTDKRSMDKFLQVFKEEISKKDVYDFFYDNDKGVMIYKNHKLYKVIKDFGFKKALYAIWLSKNPAQESLKEKMLGQ